MVNEELVCNYIVLVRQRRRIKALIRKNDCKHYCADDVDDFITGYRGTASKCIWDATSVWGDKSDREWCSNCTRKLKLVAMNKAINHKIKYALEKLNKSI